MYCLGIMKQKAFQRMKKRVVTNKRRTLKFESGENSWFATEILGEKDKQQIAVKKTFFGLFSSSVMFLINKQVCVVVSLAFVDPFVSLLMYQSLVTVWHHI